MKRSALLPALMALSFLTACASSAPETRIVVVSDCSEPLTWRPEDTLPTIEQIIARNAEIEACHQRNEEATE